ncbi:hypothetical protein BW153_08040 [Lactococcus lactis]|nr:hypothetical protein BW153_08040 [Lactococcus lactis]
MMKYRKKPVVIEAFKYDGDLSNNEGDFYVPLWAEKAYEEGILIFRGTDLFVKTLEGEMLVSLDDYIIKGVQGELYPCKPDIFGAIYEIVE